MQKGQAMVRQSRQVKANRKAKKKASARVENVRRKFAITADQMIQARDIDGKSWQQVANSLGLGSIGSARNYYKELTGNDPNESKPKVKRAPKGTGNTGRTVLHPKWDRESDKHEIRDAIQGRTIVVNRTIGGRSEISVRKVKKIGRVQRENGKWSASAVHFIDDWNGAFRAVRVVDIVEVH